MVMALIIEPWPSPILAFWVGLSVAMQSDASW